MVGAGAVEKREIGNGSGNEKKGRGRGSRNELSGSGRECTLYSGKEWRGKGWAVARNGGAVERRVGAVARAVERSGEWTWGN